MPVPTSTSGCQCASVLMGLCPDLSFATAPLDLQSCGIFLSTILFICSPGHAQGLRCSVVNPRSLFNPFRVADYRRLFIVWRFDPFRVIVHHAQYQCSVISARCSVLSAGSHTRH